MKDYKLTVELDNGKTVTTVINANTTDEAVDKLFKNKQDDWVSIHTETSIVEYVNEKKIASIKVDEKKEEQWNDNPVIIG
mgnify:CR=1 FL=1